MVVVPVVTLISFINDAGDEPTVLLNSTFAFVIVKSFAGVTPFTVLPNFIVPPAAPVKFISPPSVTAPVYV